MLAVHSLCTGYAPMWIRIHLRAHSHYVASTEAVETVGTGAKLFGKGVRGAENIGKNPAQPGADRRNTSMHLQD